MINKRWHGKKEKKAGEQTKKIYTEEGKYEKIYEGEYERKLEKYI